MTREAPSNKERILIAGNWTDGISAVKAHLKKDIDAIETVALGGLHEQLDSKAYDLVVFCLRDGEVSHEMRKIDDVRQGSESLPIIVVSDGEKWEEIVDLMKLPIQEYFHHPCAREKFRRSIVQHVKLYRMTRKIFQREQQGKVTSPFEGMVGVSEKMQEAFRIIQAVSKSNATVLITGESGTGKELVAKAIHRQSVRLQFRFVDLNCGAIPRDLLENELFGHERGAFTGAHKRYTGSFEVAHKGTLFLDEISEMDPLLQVKLLRVLQERSFMRIGGTEKIDVDVRIIAATNRNLQETIEKGQFREDLFYRLNVVNIHIPALRERREDIPLLAQHFLEYYSARNSKIFIDFAQDAIEAMINYDWPGNVRELENTVERIVVLHDDSQVKFHFLPKHIQKVNRSISFAEVSRGGGGADENRVIPLDDLERKAIETALIKFRGNVSIVAKKLRIGQATLYRKVKKYGLTQYGSVAKEGAA